MSKLFLTNINLNGNQLLNGVIHKAATAPTSPTPVVGQVYYNTADGFIYVYDGTVWDKLPISGEIVNADIKAGAAIDKLKISGTAITAGDTGTVTSTMIADGTIVDGDINASAAIALSKLAQNPLARANHTGTQTSSTISDLATVVQAYRLDQFAAPTTSVTANNQKITNLADPTNDQDAANKRYVDGLANGVDWKSSVKYATTGALGTSGNIVGNAGSTTYSNGTNGVGATITLSTSSPWTSITIDGQTVTLGDRVLIKDQAAGLQNGIYTVTQLGTTSNTTSFIFTRATDSDTSAKLSSGAATFIETGSATNVDTGWVLTTDGTITMGTTSLSFSQFTGLGVVTAGAGLTKTGNTIDVATAHVSRIVVNTDSIDLATVTQTNTTPTMGTSAVTGITVDGYGRVSGVATSTTKWAGQNPSLTVTSGSATWTITHSLGTQDLVFQVRQVSNNEIVDADLVITSTSQATVTFASTGATIAADTYRAVLIA